jgi:hypothetical protein
VSAEGLLPQDERTRVLQTAAADAFLRWHGRKETGLRRLRFYW